VGSFPIFLRDSNIAAVYNLIFWRGVACDERVSLTVRPLVGATSELGDSPRRRKAASGLPIQFSRLAVTGYKRSKTAYERFERLIYAGASVLALVALLILAFWLLSGPLDRPRRAQRLELERGPFSLTRTLLVDIFW
jgi:hypothetical protein